MPRRRRGERPSRHVERECRPENAKVSSSAWIGFYESTGLKCYGSGTGGALQFKGYGDPYLACKHLTTDVVMSGFRGSSDALVCRVIR